MRKLNNNFKFSGCAVCKKPEIFKVGNINYFQPVRYSTTPVSMLLTPELWRCEKCDSAFVRNIVTESESILLYRDGNSSERYVTTYSDEPKTKELTKILIDLFVAGAKVLDIGCNTGDILDLARSRGCETFGLEYSLESIKRLQQNEHATYTNMQDINNLFDVIMGFDLIEHIYSLPDFLETCLKYLAPDGCMIFLTGNINCISAKVAKANWWYLRYPEHIIFPSKQYFESCSKISLVDWIPSYADRAYDRPKHLVAMSTLKNVLLGDYSGLPSLTPDHAIIVLKHQKST